LNAYQKFILIPFKKKVTVRNKLNQNTANIDFQNNCRSSATNIIFIWRQVQLMLS